jgi:hypothetical protein
MRGVEIDTTQLEEARKQLNGLEKDTVTINIKTEDTVYVTVNHIYEFVSTKEEKENA